MIDGRAWAASAVLLLCAPAGAVERVGRLGVGATNEFKADLPGVSIKIHRSRAFALGLVGAFDSSNKRGGSAVGLKLYRNIFEEPQLQFYTALLAARIKEQTDDGASDRSSSQYDLVLGSEFSPAGLASLGFSVEVGLSLHDVLDDDYILETKNSGILAGSVHFYL